MLQNKLDKVQIQIQETCHVEERSIYDSSKEKTKKRLLLSQKAYFRCDKVPRSVFDNL